VSMRQGNQAAMRAVIDKMPEGRDAAHNGAPGETDDAVDYARIHKQQNVPGEFLVL
jgi:hypothetical protein